MTDHQYPKGAIESEAAVREILAAVWPYSEDEPTVTVYYVHGLGSSSYTTEYVLGRNSQIKENNIGVFIQLDWLKEYSRDFALADCNIGSHHNHHYLFANAEDAEAYLEYAKVNTPNIRSYAWDYDYDDYDYSQKG
jgi:hypothetical protein